MSTINGTNFDDNNLIGTATNDIIYGLNGNDSLLGADGADALYGGAGNDTLNGESGKDSLTGGTGDDLYYVSNHTIDNFSYTIQPIDIVSEKANEGYDEIILDIFYVDDVGDVSENGK